MLVDLVRTGAASAPDQPFLFAPTGTWSYRRFLEDAARLARVLRDRNLDRFACCVADPVERILLLCAAAWVGSTTCVFPRDLPVEREEELARRFDFPAIVTDLPRAPGSQNRVAAGELFAAAKGAHGPLTEAPEPDGPVIILTTGTTGYPRGACYVWSHLVRPARTRPAHHGTRWLLAYELSQFGGIQLLVHVIASRATLVVPGSPSIADARSAIEQHRVTHVSATPTFWRFLTAQLDDDSARRLPLELITLGGEAVPDSLLQRLDRLFPNAHVSQVYGATEFGTSVSVRDRRNGVPASILDRGEEADVRFRVVDGQLFAKSKNGMLGYYGEEPADPEGWRPTGDLVEQRGDRLHFVGRISETINVGGVKVHPLPLEQAVEAVAGVQLVRAYGKPNPVTGQIVAVDVVLLPGADPKAVEAGIHAACESLPRETRPRAIRIVDSLEVRSHKLFRGAG